MGSLALLARAAGYRVTGSDQQVYPPMSTQLQQQGITLHNGYDDVAQLNPAPDTVVVGNAMSRGSPVVEALLNSSIPYTSGPQFLAEHILPGRHVLAVAGTHGKTTTGSMLAWILQHAGLEPGFLIGGVTGNFPVSARLGRSPFFVIEADEYDTAFFDKRSKFVHYRPRTVILNNLEFDHADIFSSIDDIERQFHHMIRTVPGAGLVLAADHDPALQRVIDRGCWSQLSRFGDSTEHRIDSVNADGSQFSVVIDGQTCGTVHWSLTGEHNRHNALAAILAARHAGVAPATACAALPLFKGVKRRMELLGQYDGVHIYDDFAHHPTAIDKTLNGLRARLGDQTVIRAVIEPRSNTMKMGVHAGQLAKATASATSTVWFSPPDLGWSLQEELQNSPVPAHIENSIDTLVNHLITHCAKGEHLVLMSNGSFGGLSTKLITAFKERAR